MKNHAVLVAVLAILSFRCEAAAAANNPQVVVVKVRTDCQLHTQIEAFGPSSQIIEGKGQTLRGDATFLDGDRPVVTAQYRIVEELTNGVVASGTVSSNSAYAFSWNTAYARQGWYRAQAKSDNNSTWVDGPRIAILDVRAGSLKSRRTSLPAESPFPIKEEEHYEVGGTFEFINEADPQAQVVPLPACLRGVLEDTDGINDVLKTERGTRSLSYTFATGTDEGDAWVYFFLDFDGDSSDGMSEPDLASPEFWVMQRKVYGIQVQYSDLLGSIGGAIPGAFSSATDLLIRKDSADDWRACVTLSVASSSMFTSGPSRPDPVDCSDYVEAKKHLDATDITFVDHLIGAGGACWGNDWHSIIIDWNIDGVWLGQAIAHEFGHGVGIDHAGHSSPYLMHPLVLQPGDDILTKDDASAYDQ